MERKILLCKTAAIKGVIKDLDEVVETFDDLSMGEIESLVIQTNKIIEQICKL